LYITTEGADIGIEHVVGWRWQRGAGVSSGRVRLTTSPARWVLSDLMTCQNNMEVVILVSDFDPRTVEAYSDMRL